MPIKLKKKTEKIFSELRQDTVSGDWILLAPGRVKKPSFFTRKVKKIKKQNRFCPFDNPQKSGNESPVLVYQYKENTGWFLQVIPNKYPVVAAGNCGLVKKIGPHRIQNGVGSHEVVVLRDHEKHLSQYDKNELALLFKAYQDRYKALAEDSCVNYISIFHNHGEEAGASVPHPHSQILALPVVPPDVSYSVTGSKNYFHKYGKCVHCQMIDFERKNKKRIVFENKNAIVFAPFASRSNFELRIFPKYHQAFFEKTSDTILLEVAEVFQKTLHKIYKKFDDPPFNFFLHTAPVMKNMDYNHYHWHFEILPKLTKWGGFELGTGIDIITFAPELVPNFLK